MMGTSVQQPGAGRDEEVVKIKEISGGGGGVHESEFPLSIQIEGKSRILSVAIISFTAILMHDFSNAGGITHFSRYIVDILEDALDYPVPIDKIFSLVMWIVLLCLYAGCVMCSLLVNIEPRRKGWTKRRLCAFLGLLFWDFSAFCTLLFGILEVKDSDNSEDRDLVVMEMTSSPIQIVFFILMLAFLVAINVGFIFIPCFWSHGPEDESSEQLPMSTVIGGPPVTGSQLRAVDRRAKVVRNIQHQVVPLKRWSTAVLMERMKSEKGLGVDPDLHTIPEEENVGPTQQKLISFASFFRQIWDNVREEGDRFKYSIWMIAAVVVTVTLLLENSISLTLKLADMASAVGEKAESELQKRDQQLEQKTAGLGAESLFTALTHVDAVITKLLADSDVSKYHKELLDVGQGLALLGNHTESKDTWIEGLTATIDEYTGINFLSLPEYFADYCRVLQGTSVVGVFIGTMIGLHAVYTVLATHKRMSLRLFEHMRRSGERGSGFGIEDKYPIGRAVFFLGVMVSTTLVQQTIFAVIISLLLGIVFNFRGYEAFMQFCGYWLLVVILIILVNSLIVKHVGNRKLSDGFRIKHPRGFLVYMCVFSMLHFVLGIYYAVFRIVWLLVTTLFIISRLDITVFANGKRFDNGHSAFMATLLLARVTQQDLRYTSDQEGNEVPLGEG